MEQDQTENAIKEQFFHDILARLEKILNKMIFLQYILYFILSKYYTGKRFNLEVGLPNRF